jgi:hypothetical protein
VEEKVPAENVSEEMQQTPPTIRKKTNLVGLII